MSHYVYLDASSLPGMPDGTAREWQAFLAGQRPELEAKNWPPLLWWCLFGEEDLRWARLIDDIDADGPGGEREAFREEMGDSAEVPYPYFVTAQARALDRLARRREIVLAGVGQRYAGLYDAFAGLVARRFGPFILLRTSGLPDVTEAEPALRAVAAEMDALDRKPPRGPGPGLEGLFADVRRWGASDPVWLLSGAGAPGLWPMPELAAAYPPRRAARRAPAEARSPPVTRPRGRGAAVAEWGAALAVAGAGLGTYAGTGSILAGIAAFLGCAAVAGWVLSRPG
ncbi:hypothetical protein [Roseomonas indoligenes]|uniref:Uncharacterized protein n=1 Tax=Roseomonas indoligenes TaxID=2820811 RepID=A0A940MVR3_9PROT|nr:hypothetical protein [Pararoseomonas indoligenes]MBP0491865.1 hypothetical protein [Pararoseomonas indoligenes]